jgi:hypothetical protein
VGVRLTCLSRSGYNACMPVPAHSVCGCIDRGHHTVGGSLMDHVAGASHSLQHAVFYLAVQPS